MTQVVNRPKRATTKVSISNSLISITPSYVLSCQSRGIVTGSSVFLGKTSLVSPASSVLCPICLQMIEPFSI